MIQCKELIIGYPSKSMGPYTFSLSRGELQVLMGKNGIGKSTLLKTILTIINPIKGSISLDGQSLKNLPAADRSKRIAYVASVNPRVAHLSIEQLLSIQPQQKRVDPKKIHAALDDVGVLSLRSKFLSQLSDGEIQKAFIARALVQDSDFIILDEPLSHLDISSRLEIFGLLKSIAHDKNKGVFFSSHDLELAIAMADGIALMSNDKLVQDIPEDLVVDGTISHHFGGPNLSFSAQRGKFELCFHQDKVISVSGTGLRKQWVVHALRRIGYGVNEISNNADVQVDEQISYRSESFNKISDFIKHLSNEK